MELCKIRPRCGSSLRVEVSTKSASDGEYDGLVHSGTWQAEESERKHQALQLWIQRIVSSVFTHLILNPLWLRTIIPYRTEKHVRPPRPSRPNMCNKVTRMGVLVLFWPVLFSLSSLNILWSVGGLRVLYQLSDFFNRSVERLPCSCLLFLFLKNRTSALCFPMLSLSVGDGGIEALKTTNFFFKEALGWISARLLKVAVVLWEVSDCTNLPLFCWPKHTAKSTTPARKSEWILNCSKMPRRLWTKSSRAKKQGSKREMQQTRR